MEVGRKAFNSDMALSDSDPAAHLHIVVKESFLKESREPFKSLILDMLKFDPSGRPSASELSEIFRPLSEGSEPRPYL